MTSIVASLLCSCYKAQEKESGRDRIATPPVPENGQQHRHHWTRTPSPNTIKGMQRTFIQRNANHRNEIRDSGMNRKRKKLEQCCCCLFYFVALCESS